MGLSAIAGLSCSSVPWIVESKEKVYVNLQYYIGVCLSVVHWPTVLSTVTIMVQCCICLSSVVIYMEWIVAKRCDVEQKLPLTAYRKSYEKSTGTEMNDLDLCLEVVSRSHQPLHYIQC